MIEKHVIIYKYITYENYKSLLSKKKKRKLILINI